MTMTKRDALLGAIIGLVIAIIAPFVGANVGFPTGSFSFVIAAVIILPLACVVGLFVASLLGKWKPFFWQLGKFGLIGGLNTFIDIGILNLLIFVSGVSSGVSFSIFKGLSFAAAVINSYYWNKLWAFGSNKGSFVHFFVVSVAGLLVNVGTATIMVSVIGAPVGVAEIAWANVAAIAAIVFSLVWNFIGYKFFVFRK